MYTLQTSAINLNKVSKIYSLLFYINLEIKKQNGIYKNTLLRFFPLFKVAFAGTPIDNVRYVDFMVKDFHYLSFRINHTIFDDFRSLQVTLKKYSLRSS